jgi:hypothetical protein
VISVKESGMIFSEDIYFGFGIGDFGLRDIEK